MTTLRETPAPITRLNQGQRPKRPWHPLDLFVNAAMAARIWFLVAVGAVVLAAIQPYLLLRAHRTREQVIVLDPSGTYHVSPLLAFEEASKLHEQQALLACLALFQRNPSGFDHPELLEKLFLSDALAKARADGARGTEEFAQKHLHQKVEVSRVTVLETRDKLILVQTEGQLLRTGSLGQQSFGETIPFTARFTFARNPNLATNGRFPLAVWSYDLSF